MTLFIYLGVLYIVFFITLFYWKSLINSDFQFLFWLIILTTCVESTGIYHLKILGKGHPWVYKVYQLFEYPLICLYFFTILKNGTIRKLIYVSMAVSTLYIVILLIYPDRYEFLNRYKFLLIAFFIVIWSVSYFKSLLNIEIVLNIKKDPHFYINTGFLLFFGGSFFLMGLIFYIKERDINLARNLYSINHVLNIFYYSLLAYGFICHSKSMKS